MTDNMSFIASNQYHLPAHGQYYTASHVHHGHPHVVDPLHRTESMQRKRPKYTRSKTGCMTCRVKKIKCDESKPNCMRCTHGQRDCTWPEGAPARKKSVARKDSLDGRPSTAGSSGLSDGSTPPTREHTPTRRTSVDIGLVTMQSRRRQSDPFIVHPMTTEPDSMRRVITNNDRSPTVYSASNPLLTMIPESTNTYPPHQARYEHPLHPSRTTSYRGMNHEPSVGHWSTPEYERMVMHMQTDSHTRYQ